MATRDIKIITTHKGKIPNKVRPELAKFMAYSKLEPGLSPEFFFEWLNKPITKDWNEKYGINVSFAIKENIVVAWGHFSWSKKSEFTPELYVKVHHDEMRKGLGSQLIKELLERIPDYVQELTIPAMKEDFGSKFVQSKLNGKVIEEDRRGLLKVREVNHEDISQEMRKLSESLNKQRIRIQFSSAENLIKDGKLPSLVKLIEQVEKGFSSIKWTKERELEKVLEYKKMLNASKRNETIHEYFLAFEEDSEEIIAYTHTARNFERNKLLAWHEKTIIKPEQKDEIIVSALLHHMLNYLISQTEVTHWINQSMYNDEFLLKVFKKAGFKYFVTNLIHKVTREDWTRYLNY
ncbi:MAG: hypothetical protein HGN29_13145 [Asgard group archaeon]|nr:hypothetical protein [Asgard group archaeon]